MNQEEIIELLGNGVIATVIILAFSFIIAIILVKIKDYRFHQKLKRKK